MDRDRSDRQFFGVADAATATVTAANVIPQAAAAEHSPAMIASKAVPRRLAQSGDAPAASFATPAVALDRHARLLVQLKAVFEDSALPLPPLAAAQGVDDHYLHRLIEQQLQLMAAHVALLTSSGAGTIPSAAAPAPLPDEPTAFEPPPGNAPVVASTLDPEFASPPRRAPMDSAHPVVPGARLGRQPDGRPSWFAADPARPGRFLKVGP